MARHSFLDDDNYCNDLAHMKAKTNITNPTLLKRLYCHVVNEPELYLFGGNPRLYFHCIYDVHHKMENSKTENSNAGNTSIQQYFF